MTHSPLSAASLSLAAILLMGSATVVQAQSKSPVVEQNGFTFTLNRCEKFLSASTTCYLTIVNNRADRRINRFNDSFIVDRSGNQQKSFNLGFGNDGSSSATLIAGVPTKASISFGGVDPGVTGLAVLRLSWSTSCCADEAFTVEWRDITLVEAKPVKPGQPRR